MAQVKFLRLVYLMTLSNSAFVEGTFLQRYMACTLNNCFKLCVLLRSNRYANKGGDTKWISVLVCAHFRKTGCG